MRAVHNNTPEGPWSGRRDVLRTSRGVDEESLSRDVPTFEWGNNIERVTAELIRAMLGVPITTVSPP